MKSNIFLHFITGCLMLLYAGNLHAKPVDSVKAISFAETKGKELLDAFQEDDLAKRYQILDNMIMEYVDIKHISRFVVGKYWRVMTPQQKQQYEEIFRAFRTLPKKACRRPYPGRFRYDMCSCFAISYERDLRARSSGRKYEAGLAIRHHYARPRYCIYGDRHYFRKA